LVTPGRRPAAQPTLTTEAPRTQRGCKRPVVPPQAFLARTSSGFLRRRRYNPRARHSRTGDWIFAGLKRVDSPTLKGWHNPGARGKPKAPPQEFALNIRPEGTA